MADRGFFGNQDQRGFAGRRSRDAFAGQTYAQNGFQGGYPPQQTPQNGFAPQQTGVYPPAGSNVTIRHPKTYQDVQNLIDRLRMREQVIVDFTTLNQQSVFRILDFLSGAIYALGGSVQQLGNNMFLFVPAGVAINVPPEFARR